MNPITREMILDRIKFELSDLYPKSRSKQGTKNNLLSLISTALDFNLISRKEFSNIMERIQNDNQTRVRLKSTNPRLKKWNAIGSVTIPDVSLLPNHPFPETPKPNALVEVHFDHLYLHTDPIRVSNETIFGIPCGIPYHPDLTLDQIETISENEYQSIKRAIELEQEEKHNRERKEAQERLSKAPKTYPRPPLRHFAT